VITKKQRQHQQLFQGGYQQQSQSPVRFNKGAARGNTAGNGYGSGSKATTQQSTNQKVVDR
jgi:hypothetical protein